MGSCGSGYKQKKKLLLIKLEAFEWNYGGVFACVWIRMRGYYCYYCFESHYFHFKEHLRGLRSNNPPQNTCSSKQMHASPSLTGQCPLPSTPKLPLLPMLSGAVLLLTILGLLIIIILN